MSLDAADKDCLRHEIKNSVFRYDKLRWKMGGDWVIVALGMVFAVDGALQLRLYWPLWKSGIETRATIVKALTPSLANIVFKDASGQNHLIERCSAPRFGKFVDGDTRGLTYLPSNPAKWEWGRRKDHRLMVFFSLYFMLMGLGLVVWGVKPLFHLKAGHEVPGPATSK
jgi:hypothetical protein